MQELYFATSDRGGDFQGIEDKNVDTFRGEKNLPALGKEPPQNSIDAKRDDFDGPVRISYKLHKASISEHQFLRSVSESIASCKECASRYNQMSPSLSDFIRSAEEVIAGDNIDVLVVSDYGTTGLYGGLTGDYEASPWVNLVNANGANHKSVRDSGGTCGIGHNVYYASSSLRTVAFNTFALNPYTGLEERAFQGVVKIASTLKDGKVTNGIGKYCIEADTPTGLLPITPDQRDTFRDAVFSRDEYGTDIAIVGFDAVSDWDKRIAASVIANFFIAIAEGKLVAEVNDMVINQETLADCMAELGSINPLESEFVTLQDASTLYDAYQNGKTFVDSKYGKDVELRLLVDTSLDQSKNAFSRSKGMLVRRKRHMPRLVTFAYVCIIRGERLSEKISAAEPAEHDKWDHGIIRDPAERAETKSLINYIDSWVLRHIKDEESSFVGESVDSGIGEFLPSGVESGIGNKEADPLQIKQFFGSPKAKRPRRIPPSNPNPVPAPKPQPNPPRPEPDPDKPKRKSPEPWPGDRGKRKLRSVKIKGLRTKLLSEEARSYDAIILPDENVKRAYVSFKSMDEDGNQSLENVVSAAIDGKAVNVKDGMVGPMKFKKGNCHHVVVVLDTPGALSLVTEIGKDVKNA